MFKIFMIKNIMIKIYNIKFYHIVLLKIIDAIDKQSLTGMNNFGGPNYEFETLKFFKKLYDKILCYKFLSL